MWWPTSGIACEQFIVPLQDFVSRPSMKKSKISQMCKWLTLVYEHRARPHVGSSHHQCVPPRPERKSPAADSERTRRNAATHLSRLCRQRLRQGAALEFGESSCNRCCLASTSREINCSTRAWRPSRIALLPPLIFCTSTLFRATTLPPSQRTQSGGSNAQSESAEHHGSHCE